jgi:hypothetical protein
MVSFWGLIDKFESAAELHRFLSAVLPPTFKPPLDKKKVRQ